MVFLNIRHYSYALLLNLSLTPKARQKEHYPFTHKREGANRSIKPQSYYLIPLVEFP